MPPKSMPIVALSEMVHGQEADLFALLTAKEELTTREGKPYFKVGFRDAHREVSFPVWDNSPWAAECRKSWTPGVFYKLRAVYRETNYGPQLEIRKIRETVGADAADGFDPAMCVASTRFDPESMFAELVQIAEERVENVALGKLVVAILSANRQRLLVCPAARRHHHAFCGGLLEHTLSVTRNALFLADKYADAYPDLQPPLDKGLVVAGAILHDLGKVRELAQEPTGTSYTPEGELIGHLLLGRDMVREAAARVEIDADRLLRLEHLILSHQRLPEWGSPKPPMTPEALLVHYADDVDAKYHMMVTILRDDNNSGPFTSNKNLLHQKVYRGPNAT
ncbi:MAG: nucleotide-binding protein [Planctomycetes bacterium RBG_16_64_12]|nr:MAG: nucleotide-binding protein [Planctomycetes bacterium RBG_16_64_12]